jgi:hypothetical protein
MPYVVRNAEGAIIAVYGEPVEGSQEIAHEDMELRAFLAQSNPEAAAKWQFIESDLALVRVLEDLIGVLVDKGVILFTDLPEPAQRKLMARSGLRKEFSYVQKLFGTEEDVEIDPAFVGDADGDGYI